MNEQHDSIVIGAGQAGLATSWYLGQHGVDHVVLERGRIAETWRSRRWDTFRLQIPNRMSQLPGFGYTGDDPDGFMPRDEVVSFFEAYASSFRPPIREGIEVRSLRRDALAGAWVLETSAGEMRATNVVVATGAYQLPRIPELAARLDSMLVQLHADAYRNPDQLPTGAVLVIGGGASGLQIAAELADAGRDVYLSLGKCAWMPRRYRGRDITMWGEATGFPFQLVDTLPSPAARLAAPPALAPSDAGETLTPRTLARRGVTLTGRLVDANGLEARFAADLGATLAAADGFVAQLRRTIDGYIAAKGIDAPAEPPEADVDAPPAEVDRLDLRVADVRSVIWATGYRMDLGWIEGIEQDAEEYPLHERGVTTWLGLYFVGLPWLHTRSSSFIPGVGADAAFIVDHLVARSEQDAGTLRAGAPAGVGA